jgi:hypothetical protein
VTLERDRPSPFLPEEVAAVEAAIARHTQPEDYHLAVKRDQIVISERAGRMTLPPGWAALSGSHRARLARFAI